MKRVVLTYEGSKAGRSSAEASLRRQIPGIVLTPKTQSHVEAEVEDAQVPLLKQVSGWSISLPTFAEIRPPALNLKNMRAKLSGSR
ncbi:MAG: hypothetical protein J0M00_02595 [Burkholderiales bacterium]|nr:hypothetical protein [Burkholderiales bacterium]